MGRNCNAVYYNDTDTNLSFKRAIKKENTDSTLKRCLLSRLSKNIG